MKKSILLVLMALVCCGTFANKPEVKTETVAVSGYFLKTNYVNYEVYKVANDTWEFVTEGKGFRTFKVSLELESNYVIVFRKEGITKVLYIQTVAPEFLEIDVDFSSRSDASILYNQEKKEYIINKL